MRIIIDISRQSSALPLSVFAAHVRVKPVNSVGDGSSDPLERFMVNGEVPDW